MSNKIVNKAAAMTGDCTVGKISSWHLPWFVSTLNIDQTAYRIGGIVYNELDPALE